MARLLLSLLLLSYAIFQSVDAKSIGRSRHTQLLLTHQRKIQNDALLSSSSSTTRNTRSPRLYAANDILERLRGGGAFLGGGSNNNKDTASLLTKTSQDDVSTTKPMKEVALLAAAVALGYILGYLTINIDTFKSILSSTKSTLSTFFDKERFRSAIITNLNNIASKGNIGLFIYTIGFIFYETCGMPTSVLETCAGMAFGFQNGLLCSFIGKTCGSILAFTLGRTLLSNYVGNKMKDNESFGLIERGVAKNPTQSALIVRYSPFPQLIKNFSLGLTKSVSYPIFLLAILIHGLPFSILWAALGNDSSIRLRASDAGEVVASNKVLNWLLAFVTFFGFVVSPAITGWWLADLRKDSC